MQPNEIAYSAMKHNYSTSEYRQRSLRAKKHTLHFLIGLDQSLEMIQKQIETWKVTAFSKLIDGDEQVNGIRPLHLAALKGNVLLVEVLLKTFQEKSAAVFEEQINGSDKRGWTALHHSRLTSKKVYELLIKYGADPTRCSLYGATPEDLDSWVIPQGMQASMSKITVALPGKEERSLSQFSSNELFNLFGLKQYRDRRLYPSELALNILWDRIYTHTNADAEKLNQQCKQLFLQAEYPQLKLAPCALLQNKVPASHAFEVRANQQIAKGAFVCEAGGEFVENEPEVFSLKKALQHPGSDYCGFKVDPEKIGNV